MSSWAQIYAQYEVINLWFVVNMIVHNATVLLNPWTHAQPPYTISKKLLKIRYVFVTF